jgi:DUF2937 family protein
MGKFLAMILGIAGALAGSQAPGFTLQYMQNLNGRVSELKPMVARFDADVAKYGYTRQNALNECEVATGLLDALCSSYGDAINRYEILSAHLQELQEASDLMRPVLIAKSYQKDIAVSVMEEFKPAIPATIDGGIYAAGGFVGLWTAGSLLFGLLGAPFRRRRDPEGRWA